MNRNRLSRALAGVSLVAVGALAPVLAQPASAISFTTTTIIVKATDSDGGQFADGTGSARISDDGYWLGFSRLTTPGSYVKSLVSGATALVSLNDADQPANATSSVEGISADGSKVLFATAATNMGAGPVTARDLYVRSLDTGETERVNLTGGTGTQVAVRPGESTLSDDGATVAFATQGAISHVYARVWSSHVSFQVDVSTNEAQGNGSSREPSVSSDGRYISFTSFSSDLVPLDQNFVSDVFVRDREAGTTLRASLADNGLAPNGPSNQSSISASGTSIAFSSTGTNLVAGDTNNEQDVFMRRTGLGDTLRLSLATGGAQANGASGHADLAPNGNKVAFESNAPSLDYSSNKALTDVFVRDISGNSTVEQGLDGNDGPNLGTFQPSVATGANAVAYTSAATNLVTEDTNGAGDAFAEHSEWMGPFVGMSQLVPRTQSDFGASPGANAAREANIENGRLTPAHLVVDLAHQPAWAQHREPVARLYQAFFHRKPDLNGLNYWVKKRQGGTKLGVIAAQFASSNEFKTAYGTVGNSAFVTLVYENVLQREPDAAGLNHWVNKMAGGMSRGDVMVAFSESSEGKRFLAPEVDATLMGIGMLHKMPSDALWKNTAAAIRNGRMSEWGAATLLTSIEYYEAVWT